MQGKFLVETMPQKVEIASLAVAGAVFNPTAATLDAERIAIGTDTKIYFTDRVFGQIRYDTRRGENLIEHEGWAGLTLKF